MFNPDVNTGNVLCDVDDAFHNNMNTEYSVKEMSSILAKNGKTGNANNNK